ncbi:hypothetical protein N5079_20095 [Planotetraspora sp. A-T 1434]|uniref:hypothetical protein n=1 Tax=Planotetraspora sp. A-T 1434 TaxID=2979219 RepID=UPI0021BF785F|nr:hypothetical protein [Planotetraspora sp. A-T 1434]MCT9932506.1 hypothetical protein [Planotetraspora sp. A-T 1434]
MKRVIAGIAGISAVTAVALVTATPAHAAPADPVKALKSQFIPGKGVKFTDRTVLIVDGKSTHFLRRTGSFQFGKAGIAASDISAKYAATDSTGTFAPERTIRIGTTTYTQGGIYRQKLPEGKSWYKDQGGMTGGASGWLSQLVNVAEPATLKTLLSSAKQAHGSYSGTTTFARLAKVSPWFRATLPIRSSDKTVVTFKLTLGRNGLPQRLTTSYPATGLFDSDAWEGKTVSVETRFTGWGSKVSIKAPPASKVTTKLQSDDG